MAEIRTLSEGTFRWARQATGSGYQSQVLTGGAVASPYTASASNNLVGYVQEGMTINQPRTIETIHNRGTAGHFKQTLLDAGKVDMTVMWGITADYPPTATAVGESATVPLFYAEWKSTAPEQGAAIYYLFQNCVNGEAPTIAENSKGDTDKLRFHFTTMVGPTASAFLS